MEEVTKYDTDKRYRRVLSASTIKGDDVKNRADENLGSIQDLMIDLESGRIAYAVLSFGGFLHMGNKLFAIPWSAFTVDEDRKCLILDADKSTLENAPGFDKDNWPDMADQTWGERIYSYYGQTPYWTERKGTGREDIGRDLGTGTTGTLRRP
ncbi:MAG TPA: PRC-barrel domain-containing protein [Bryobacteraceae bacterium]|nr:PRC-barrel domain-containing protein [Bryobacteraceae bacterium]